MGQILKRPQGYQDLIEAADFLSNDSIEVALRFLDAAGLFMELGILWGSLKSRVQVLFCICFIVGDGHGL